jgi:Fe-S oxidoreductase
MGSGHVGSIPLLAALATRLEQARVAEAIIRRAGLPGIDAVRPREGATCCGFPEPGH